MAIEQGEKLRGGRTRALKAGLAALLIVGGTAAALYFNQRDRRPADPHVKISLSEKSIAAAVLVREHDEKAKGEPAPLDATSVESQYRDAVSRSDAKAIYKIGLKLESGSLGTPRDYVRAQQMFNEAAAMGDADAMYRSGFYAEHGINGKPDASAARDYYEKAAQAGYVDGFAAIAKMYIEGRVVVPDQQTAAMYIEKGIKAGSSEALFLKGITLLDLSPNSADALVYLRKAAEAENTNAQQMIARLYRDGRVLEKDEQKALEWARLAAASGAAGAQVDLANLLLTSKASASPSDNEAVASEAVANLVSAQSQQNARASLAMAQLNMSTPPRGQSDVLNVRKLAVQAFEGGEKQAAFAVALTFSMDKQNKEAEEWLAKGAVANDWRSRYARDLMKNNKSVTVQEAIRIAAQSTFEDYTRSYSENAPKDKRGTTPPSPLRMSMPTFPQGLEALATQGKVHAEFIVNEKGVPTRIQVLETTHPQLATATIAAISEWRFKPAMRNGVAVTQRVQIPIKFQSSR